MLAVNYSTLRENLKTYCDKATEQNETVLVTRKNEKNVVIVSLAEWNAMQKRIQNAEYLEKLNQSMAEIQDGKGIAKTIEELEAMEDA